MIITLIITSALVALFVLTVKLYMKQEKFGRISIDLKLEQIKKSPHYRNGKFQNLNFTPDLTEGVSYLKVLKEFFFNKSKQTIPVDVLPSVKTNLHTLPKEKNVIVWFGHSSYFLQIDGKKILVDPVFSGNASPVKFTTKSFKGTDIYTTDDIPEIDYLFITHDHWDHLDYETLIKLQPKLKKIITGLGTATHLEHWSFDPTIIFEKDWNEIITLEEGFTVHTTSARHFSGRGFKRNQVLWMSFVLQTPSMKIFIGGDSGYDAFFKSIGESHGPFDVTVLECGQYNQNWKYIHMMPEEVIQAGIDLKAKKILPVHWGKFALAQHHWNDPIKRVTAEGKRRNVPVLHPMIGEEVDLTNPSQIFLEWWNHLN